MLTQPDKPYHFTHKQRSELKHSICSHLTYLWDKRKYPCDSDYYPCDSDYYPCDSDYYSMYSTINQFIADWASHSSQSMQDSAERILLQKKKPTSIIDFFIQLVYEETQKELAIRKIKYMKLFRGQYYPILSLNPLSSFSTSKAVARRFAGNSHIYSASIPAKFIASAYFTGYGCAEEHEYVVWGGRNVVRHLKLDARTNNY